MIKRRRRIKQANVLEVRLEQEAVRLREEARLLPPGGTREELLRKARQAESAAQMSELLRTPGMRLT
jgi:hypothetical protein